MDIRYRILGVVLSGDGIVLGGSVLGAVGDFIAWLDDLVWGPWMLALLLGSGCYLMVRMDFFPIKNLKFALRCALGIENREGRQRKGRGKTAKTGGSISSLSSLTTELATTLGIGNIVGVASAMVLGGPGALFWMVATSVIGLATKLAESMLAVKYRGRNDRGEIAGGPMYTCRNAFPHKRFGRMLGFLFALFAVTASIGMGNMTQSNSIADALWVAFSIPKAKTGLYLTVLTVLVVIGGIGVIGKVTQVLVPFMGVFYLCGAFAVILVHWRNVPVAVGGILTAAFCPQAVSGGIFGSVTATMFQSLRWGVSRGIFSNEAGLGASGITAAAADTEDYIKQGCISMTGVFLDTVVVCTITGLAFAASGVLGTVDANGKPLTGTALTLAAFRTALGDLGGSFISVCIALFAFATVIGWAYQGEKAFEFLMGGRTKYNLWYRFFYGLAAFLGCICSLETVWNFSDICNALMAVPNLICVLALSGKACKEIREYPVPGERRAMGSRNSQESVKKRQGWGGSGAE